MGLISAKGNEAVQSAGKSAVDLSEIMIRLKDKESVKVRLLSAEDFVEYEAISEFSLGVYTQPSREPLGEKDYFIEAGKLAKQKAEGVDEKFEKLYPRKRYLIAMADIGTGKLRAWDCSKSQFNNFVAQLEEYKELIDMQVVAFPQEGIFKAPGTEQMMYEAMDMGADVVGGIPYNDAPAKEHIDLVFEIAKKYDKDVDLHQDFADEADDMSIEYLCEKTIAEGYQGRVSVGHLTALHALPEAELAPIIAKMAEANISVMALPATDLHLGARGDQYNVRRAVTPIRKLRDGGVNVCIATNNIRNAFTPYGTGDIVQTAMLAIPVGHLGGADDLKTVLPMVTTSPARAMGLEGYGVAVGNKADLVLLDTKVVEHAIIDIPERLYVIKNGRVTVKTDKKVEIIR